MLYFYFVEIYTVEAVQAALKRTSFFSTFGKKNTIVTDGTFDLGDNQASCDLFYPFIEECLRYIKANTEDEWNKGDRARLINSLALSANRTTDLLFIMTFL